MCAHRINYYILKIARKVRFILLFGDYYVISAKSKHPAICIMEIPQGLVIMNTGEPEVPELFNAQEFFRNELFKSPEV